MCMVVVQASGYMCMVVVQASGYMCMVVVQASGYGGTVSKAEASEKIEQMSPIRDREIVIR